jgi:hypothetical protein
MKCRNMIADGVYSGGDFFCRLWRWQLRKLASKQSKPIWVSEFGCGTGALALVKQVLKDLVTLRPSAWIYWWVDTDDSPGTT